MTQPNDNVVNVTCACCGKQFEPSVYQNKQRRKGINLFFCGKECIYKGKRQRSVKVDLIGTRFGRLTVVEEAPRRGYRRRYYCQCDCGQQAEVGYNELTQGNTESCGCFRREFISQTKRTHGMRFSTEFNIWSSMRQRCNNPNNHAFAAYGGRGITVCKEWNDSFEQFYKDIGPRLSPDLSIDRINNDLGYFPGNVRWATRTEQRLNTRTRSIDRLIEYDGVIKNISQWARDLGISSAAMTFRINNGWPLEKALFKPKRINRSLPNQII